MKTKHYHGHAPGKKYSFLSKEHNQGKKLKHHRIKSRRRMA
jgi:hypothetical protein